MKQFFKNILFALLLTTAATPAFGDPPRANHYHWRNTNDNQHYMLYDYASQTWVETVYCKVVNRFTLVSNETNTLTLYDASRNMTVLLNYEGFWIKASGATEFTFYQPGTFDTRTQFTHNNPDGTYTGAITKLHGCTWVEYLAGVNGPAFYFTQRSTTNDFVELYDGSRNLYVGLQNTKMWLSDGGQPYVFFKDGKW